ncbi:MAG: hypothetical protein ACFCU9_08110 [Cyanophyceae cyanobacterium]|jgi:hypothetical protein
MEDDEWFVLMVVLLFGGIGWYHWLALTVQVSALGSRVLDRLVLLLLPVGLGWMLTLVMRQLADIYVQTYVIYQVFYVVMGLTWAIGIAGILPWLMGIGQREDVLERRNSAALPALCGALIGGTFTFAGANIGDGPGWWVVVFCSLLSTGTWLALWLWGESRFGWRDAIVIDRDPATSWRLAGLLVGSGLILGGSVAGDWEGTTEAIASWLWLGSLVIPLGVVAWMMEPRLQLSKGQSSRPALDCGILPGGLYVVLAMALLSWVGG